MQEGGIYVISRFRISNAKSGYRPVDSLYMVEFTMHTTISAARTDLPDFPQYAYKITPIDALASHAGDTKNFLDTIGLLVEVSEAYTVRLPNKPAPILTRHIVLRDLSYSEIKITLWGQRAAAFTTDAVYSRDIAKPFTVLFVGGLVKSYQGTYYLSANTASCWYFDPPIPEAQEYATSCLGQKLEIRFVVAPREDQTQQQAPTERMEKTLRQLNDMDPYDFADNGYRCTITVARLIPNASWWFPSCTKCSKSCVPDGTGYRCNACSNTSFKFKYKICFVASDGTGEAEMICFGDVARRIIGKPVQQILRSATSPNRYPPEIAKIVSLRFTFAIALSQQSFYREEKTYQVISVISAIGRQPPTARVSGSGGNGSSSSYGGAEDSSHNISHDMEEASDATLSSPLLTTTPPPASQTSDPPSVKSQPCGGLSKKTDSSAKKRLTFQSEVADQLVTKDSQTEDQPLSEATKTPTDMLQKSVVDDKDHAPEKKRRSGDQLLPQE